MAPLYTSCHPTEPESCSPSPREKVPTTTGAALALRKLVSWNAAFRPSRSPSSSNATVPLAPSKDTFARVEMTSLGGSGQVGWKAPEFG